jgi:ATP-dependent Clp protease ATP-binding subunit ClpA
VIQKSVQDPLAEAILAGRIMDGQSVDVSEHAGRLVIEPATVH